MSRLLTRYAYSILGAAFRTHGFAFGRWKFMSASAAALDARAILDLQCQVLPCRFHYQSLKAERERLGIDPRQLSHANANFREVCARVPGSFGSDPIQDGGGYAEFVQLFLTTCRKTRLSPTPLTVGLRPLRHLCDSSLYKLLQCF